jgi:hypothetical protein
MPNIRAIAVSAFSPPEELDALEALARRLRDDLDAAFERVVSSSRVNRRGRPRTGAEGVLKLVLIAANASTNRAGGLVDALDRLAGLGDRSVGSFRWVVRNTWRVSSSSNCSIAIMLTGPAARSWRARR